MTDNILGLDPQLLELLRCPEPHHARLKVDQARHQLVCTECGVGFGVADGIPIMLLDEASGPTQKITSNEQA